MLKYFVMICPSLVDQGGHEYDYTCEVAKAVLADGIDVTTLVPPTAKDINLPGKILFECCTDILPRGLPAKIRALGTKFFFYGKLFYKSRATSTQFFIHTISQKQLILVALGWMMTPSKDNKLVLFLRHAIGSSFSDRVLIRVLGLASHYGVSYVSDSDLLIENLAPRLSCTVTLVPIPLTLPEQPVKRNETHPLCSYFGARRKTKGFHLLPTFIDAASEASPSLYFNIQAYLHRDAKPEDDVETVFASLKQHPNTVVLNQVLSSEDFAQLIFKSDIALIPCDPSTYRTSTSGIFTMAVVARAIVITTEGTWMAHQARQYKMTRVVLLPWPATPENIHTAMQQALTLLARPDAPSPEEQEWCDSQSAKSLWCILRQL